MYASPSGTKTDFVRLIVKQFLVRHSNTLELEKHFKQYQQKLFYHDALFC